MRKLVRESIGFERGGDPRKTMKVGKLERLKEKYGNENLDILLIEASEAGNLNDVKFLVQQGADVHAEDDNPLEEAVRRGQLDVVKYLVEKGNGIINPGYVLYIAIRNGHLDVVDYLKSKIKDE